MTSASASADEAGGGWEPLLHVDLAGPLMGEYEASGKPVYEVVYLGDMPVAVVTQSSVNGSVQTNVSYIYADHLETPRVIVRSSDHAIQWRWDQAEAFGNSQPDANPNNLGAFAFNLRFPGQIYDSETGLSYNHHRDYAAMAGRYIQSDPIGLDGGINTYAYVEGNPLSYTDPQGLAPGDKSFGINDKGFWKWWEKNKYDYGPFDKSHEGFNPKKPFDLPNKEMADVYREEYEQCKTRDAGRGGKAKGPKLPRLKGVGGRTEE